MPPKPLIGRWGKGAECMRRLRIATTKLLLDAFRKVLAERKHSTRKRTADSTPDAEISIDEVNALKENKGGTELQPWSVWKMSCLMCVWISGTR